MMTVGLVIGWVALLLWADELIAAQRRRRRRRRALALRARTMQLERELFGPEIGTMWAGSRVVWRKDDEFLTTSGAAYRRMANGDVVVISGPPGARRHVRLAKEPTQGPLLPSLDAQLRAVVDRYRRG